MAPIKDIEYFLVKPRWLFVKLTDERGRFGWGEATLEGHTRSVSGALDEIKRRIIGFEAEYVHHYFQRLRLLAALPISSLVPRLIALKQ